MVMDFELGKKSGQIPAFGDWDNANDLPITQYFETARQAGLLRFPNAAAPAHHPHRHHQYRDYNSHVRCGGNGYSCSDPYGADFQKPPFRVVHVPHHRKAVDGGGHGMKMNSSGNINGDDHKCGGRRRGRGCHCCPPHLKEQQQQRIKQVDMKHQHQQRTRRSSTSSEQLFHMTGHKKQFPKHSVSAIADVHKPPHITAANNNVKPVDEDLYKIPPELLLHHSKRKKVLGFFSRCLVPPCSA